MLGRPYIWFQHRYVWQSACYSGPQTAVITYRIWGFHGVQNQWVLAWKGSYKTSIPTGGAWATSHNWWAQYLNSSVDVNVEWHKGPATGPLLGSVYLNYNETRDYACYGCTLHPDPIVGAFMHWNSA